MKLHYVWDRIHCRWRIWRGTLKAWKALPHAVVGATCAITVGSVAVYNLRVEPTLPTVPVKPVPKSVYLAGMTTQPVPGPSYYAVNLSLPWIGPRPTCEAKQDHDRDDCPKKRTVPEPGTWAMMLAGVAMVIFRSGRSARR